MADASSNDVQLHLKVGMIVVEVERGPGTSRTHYFAEVTKLTPSGRFRCNFLAKNFGPTTFATHEDVAIGRDRTVTPILKTYVQKSVLADDTGYFGSRRDSSIFEEEYDPNKKYWDTDDLMA